MQKIDDRVRTGPLVLLDGPMGTELERHRSADTLRIYIRTAEAFKDHAGAGLL